MRLRHRLPAVFSAVPSVLAIIVLSVVLVVAHDNTSASERANHAAIATACTTTHNGLTDVIAAIGVAVEEPTNGHAPSAAEVRAGTRFVRGLQDAADADYKTCLTKATH